MYLVAFEAVLSARPECLSVADPKVDLNTIRIFDFARLGVIVSALPCAPVDLCHVGLGFRENPTVLLIEVAHNPRGGNWATAADVLVKLLACPY